LIEEREREREMLDERDRRISSRRNMMGWDGTHPGKLKLTHGVQRDRMGGYGSSGIWGICILLPTNLVANTIFQVIDFSLGLHLHAISRSSSLSV
jgi:hypothetical protein